ncbi:NfeD family protein [Cerasicoccus arenae]|uniref:Membrane protein n=1 Tax=Cerasicoccus arenae TaxID=424488 RepID=A0A8J3DIT4_9BACT|nr:NfeD family protein [Cerasicoccus arenae]MBK1859918.1 hypothetical protein [Cerasicoccus arenae]GHC12956.1 membrane protein [Cerasicoccus arenae]
MILIIGLIIAGLLLISFEIVVPGGVLGTIGVLSVMGAVGVAYAQYGVQIAAIVFLASLVIITVMVIVEFQLLPKTKLGKQFFLSSSSGGAIRYGQRDDNAAQEDSLIGQQGEALTTMAPSGRIMISGKSYEGYSQSGLLNKGTLVEVVARDAFRVVVKKVS